MTSIAVWFGLIHCIGKRDAAPDVNAKPENECHDNSGRENDNVSIVGHFTVPALKACPQKESMAPKVQRRFRPAYFRRKNKE